MSNPDVAPRTLLGSFASTLFRLRVLDQITLSYSSEMMRSYETGFRISQPKARLPNIPHPKDMLVTIYHAIHGFRCSIG